MKKRLIILLLMAAVLLAACTQNENKHIYETAVNDQLFTVDTKQNTITHMSDVYRYEDGKWPEGMRIIYPNGADFQNGIGSSNYDPERYVDGETLIGVASGAESRKADNKVEIGNLFLGLFLCGVGAFNLFCPQLAWYLEFGWKFRDAEPSDFYLGFIRFGGGVAALIGIVLFLTAIF